MTDWHVLPIAPVALDRAVTLHGLCFPEDGWSRDDFAGILAMTGARGWWAIDAADRHATPQGFLFDLLLAPAGEIITLGVAPVARRHGAARVLLADLFARARAQGVATLTLEVAEDNRAALRLYQTIGFERVGSRPGYYRRPNGHSVDAHLLRRAMLP